MLTKTELDMIKCAEPHCEHKDEPEMVMMAACHPRSGLLVTYTGEGVLHMRCSECSMFVADVAVAEGGVN